LQAVEIGKLVIREDQVEFFASESGFELRPVPGGDDFAPISIFNSAEDFSDTASLIDSTPTSADPDSLVAPAMVSVSSGDADRADAAVGINPTEIIHADQVATPIEIAALWDHANAFTPTSSSFQSVAAPTFAPPQLADRAVLPPAALFSVPTQPVMPTEPTALLASQWTLAASQVPQFLANSSAGDLGGDLSFGSDVRHAQFTVSSSPDDDAGHLNGLGTKGFHWLPVGPKSFWYASLRM